MRHTPPLSKRDMRPIIETLFPFSPHCNLPLPFLSAIVDVSDQAHRRNAFCNLDCAAVCPLALQLAGVLPAINGNRR